METLITLNEFDIVENISRLGYDVEFDNNRHEYLIMLNWILVAKVDCYNVGKVEFTNESSEFEHPLLFYKYVELLALVEKVVI